MLISLTVGKVDAGVAVLLTQDKRLIEFPSILLPPNITSGSIVDITVARNQESEQKSSSAFLALQSSIFKSFGSSSPSAPVLRCRNATQTAVVLEWDPIDVATADIISLSLFRNGQKAGSIPRPSQMQSTKISGLAVDTEYTFHLVLRTSAGTYSSEKVVVKTHKMTDLSGITITPGVLPGQLRDSLLNAVERIGAKMADSVRIDTTHFVTTEGRGVAWEKAVEMNIPVVRPEWVEGCERGGRVVGVRQYYLDADPRQRQVVTSTPAALQNVSPRPLSSEATREDTNGAAPPPTPPAKDTPRQAQSEALSSNPVPEEEKTAPDSEKNEVLEEEKTAAQDEQKVLREDNEQFTVALRPTPMPADEEDEPEEIAEKTEELRDGEGDGDEEEKEETKSGEQTPGHSSFQDVAL